MEKEGKAGFFIMSNTSPKTRQADLINGLFITDNGGRRCVFDRRQYSYTLHIPERRLDRDRRSGEDRRHILQPEVTRTDRLNYQDRN